jgi:hypothetical protein
LLIEGAAHVMEKRILRLNVDAEEQNICDFDEIFVSYKKTNGDRRSVDVGWHVLPIVDIDDKANHSDAFTDENISRTFRDAITPLKAADESDEESQLL